MNTNMLNLAAFHPGTRALGPGLRAVVWVQGCPFSCQGCIAPDWIPFQENKLVDPYRMAQEILKIQHLDGITISGGEPMMQAEALSTMLAAVFSQTPLTVIVFTGFKYEKLLKNPPNPGVKDFLSFVDVLIDGQFVESLNDAKGLRGSSNQRFHFLTAWLKDFNFETLPREIELYFQGTESFLVGIPTPDFSQAYNKAFKDHYRTEAFDERA